MKITAAVLRDPEGRHELETVELAEPRDDEVLVRIVATGMCHTDVLPRAEISLSPPPIIVGHEGSGIVEAVGSAVEGVAVGDHVVLSFDSCGECAACLAGRPPYCETMIMRNLTGRRIDFSTGATDEAGAEIASRWFGQSSFATYAVATARNVVVVDRDVPLELLGPLGCGILTGAGTVMVAFDAQPGSSVAVFGAGAVGLAAVMAAKVAGCETIVAVDLHQHRLELATELGATHVVDGAASDVVMQVHAATGGGADYALDTTGNPQVILATLGSLKMGGHAGLVGIQTGDVVLDAATLIGKTASGILEGDADPQVLIPRLVELWKDGQFPFDRLIEQFPLDQINEAEAASLEGRVVKPVLLAPT